MGIDQYEMYHGAVLAKVTRQEEFTLRLIETQPKRRWARYGVNDCSLLVKYRTIARDFKSGGGCSWSFTFHDTIINRLGVSLHKEESVYLALVGGRERTDEEPKEIALLKREDFTKLIDIEDLSSQNITVRAEPGKSLRAMGSNLDDDPIVVPRNRIDTWDIPT